MAASSPSEFLTFYRYAARRTSINSIARPNTTSRPFHTSFAASLQQTKANAAQEDVGSNRRHVLDKKDHGNVQEQASNAGREARATGEGASTAQAQKGGKASTDKAKKEHPEAPDTVIGMQDERGGKGA